MLEIQAKMGRSTEEDYIENVVRRILWICQRILQLCTMEFSKKVGILRDSLIDKFIKKNKEQLREEILGCVANLVVNRDE